MIGTKFHLNWPAAGPGEDISFLNLSEFLLFCYYLSFGPSVAHHLSNLESLPSKDDLCKVWLKWTQWFWRRSIKCKSKKTDE
jgi:hypothetical protein